MWRDDFLNCAKYDNGLLRLEADMIEHARQNRENDDYCANEAWFSDPGFKARMSELVGRCAKVPELATSNAYEIATWHLYSLLPNCAHEGWDACRC